MKRYAILLLLAAGLQAQESKELESGWDLTFQIQELQAGKIVSNRTYKAMLAAVPSSKVSIRSGSKVRYETGIAAALQWQYADVGVNIDCSMPVALHNGQLSFTVSIDTTWPNGNMNSDPTIRQNRWAGTVIVQMKKPVIIFSSDDPGSKTRLQVEMTATPIP